MDQKQMFYQASRHNAERDLIFLELVQQGMTREDLQTNIDRRPSVWERYANWLDRLPTKREDP